MRRTRPSAPNENDSTRSARSPVAEHDAGFAVHVRQPDVGRRRHPSRKVHHQPRHPVGADHRTPRRVPVGTAVGQQHDVGREELPSPARRRPARPSRAARRRAPAHGRPAGGARRAGRVAACAACGWRSAGTRRVTGRPCRRSPRTGSRTRRAAGAPRARPARARRASRGTRASASRRARLPPPAGCGVVDDERLGQVRPT